MREHKNITYWYTDVLMARLSREKYSINFGT